MQVRNTANGIVQFEYGDDGRDPVAMEGESGQALDLERMLSHLRATTCPCGPADPSDDARRCLQRSGRSVQQRSDMCMQAQVGCMGRGMCGSGGLQGRCLALILISSDLTSCEA